MISWEIPRGNDQRSRFDGKNLKTQRDGKLFKLNENSKENLLLIDGLIEARERRRRKMKNSESNEAVWKIRKNIRHFGEINLNKDFEALMIL